MRKITNTHRYIYTLVHFSIRTNGPDNVLWYCPWEIQDYQQGTPIFDGYIVRNFKHGQAVWWQAHPRTQREETEMRPPCPSKGDEFDQLMGLEPASINRQTPRSKPMAIPTLLTLFVARFTNKLEFFLSHSLL